jgi:hypothetical protein
MISDNEDVFAIVDKVIMYFDDYDGTNINTAFEKAGFPKVNTHDIPRETFRRILQVMTGGLGYIEAVGNSMEWYLLTEKGRIVKRKGGHFAFNSFVENEEAVGVKRSIRKDKAEEADLKLKQWTYKARYIPFLFSSLALAVSLLTCSRVSKNVDTPMQPDKANLQTLPPVSVKRDTIVK